MPKKKYQVIKATTREIPGLTVGGRVKKFSKNGTFETNDSGEAAEIDKVLGMKGTGEVVVTPYEQKEHGHNYTFAQIGLMLPPRETVIGTTKQVGGVLYRYIEDDGKLRLIPVKSITQKRNRGAKARR